MSCDSQRRKRRRDDDHHQQLADFDTKVEGKQRPAQRPARQTHLTQHVGEPKPMNEAEAESGHGRLS